MDQQMLARWLKSIAIVIAAALAIFFFFLMPWLTLVLKHSAYIGFTPPTPAFSVAFLIAVDGAVIPCAAALGQFIRIASNIGRDRSFSHENAQLLRGYPVVVGVGTYVRATVESMYEQLVMPAASLCAGSANFTLRYISVCGYDKAVRESFRTPAQPITGTPAGETVAAMLSMVKTQLGNIRPFADIPQSADDHLASALEYSGAGDTAAAADAIARLQEALEGVCGAADFICAELEYCRVLIAAAMPPQGRQKESPFPRKEKGFWFRYFAVYQNRLLPPERTYHLPSTLMQVTVTIWCS